MRQQSGVAPVNPNDAVRLADLTAAIAAAVALLPTYNQVLSRISLRV